MTTPATALRAILVADARVSDLASDRIFTPELPRQEAADMPRHCVVFRGVGAGYSGIGRASYLKTVSVRFDVFSYGETPYEAERLHWRVMEVLKGITRQVQDDLLVYPLVIESGPVNAREPDTEWPVCWSSYRGQFQQPEGA